MEAKILFKKALEQATATVKCVETRHFRNPTPCTDWDCRALVNHMLYELAWVPDMLAGKTVKQVGDKYDGDLLGKDHIKSWQKAADKALEAVNKVKLDKKVHLSLADVTAGQYLAEVGGDLLIHSWDADQSLSCSLVIEPKLAQAIYDDLHPKMKKLAATGDYGKPFEAPEDARLQTKLLAIVGRREPSV